MTVATTGEDVTLIRPRSGWIAVDWKELWSYRELLFVLVSRDVTVRYKQTVLGVAWAVLQPLFTMIVFSVIFGRLANMPSDGVPYPVFVFAGLVPWTFFASSVTSASQSLINQQALLTKIYLPRLFVPASTVGSALVDMAISFVVLAAMMAIYGVVPGVRILAILPLVLITAVAALGVGLLLSALTITYRDVRHVVPFLVQAWLYVSPVIYPVALVPREWQWLLALNPMTGVIDAFRSALLDKPWNWSALGISTLSAFTILVWGLFYFRRTERRFADIA